MKVKMKYGISTYSGKIDEIVFESCKNDTICIARKYFKPKETPYNSNFRIIMNNILSIWKHVQQTYKEDLQKYCLRLVPEKNKMRANSFSMFIRMLYACQKDAVYDLRTMTLSDLQATSSIVNTVAKAITAGYLPAVDMYSDLTHVL